MSRFYMHAGGGLGDVIDFYFRERTWGCIEDVKRRNPKSYIRLILCCHNPSSREFHEKNPYIDEILYNGWMQSGKSIYESQRGDCRLLSEVVAYCTYVKPSVWLSDQDKEIVERAIDGQPFVLFHPFAAGFRSTEHLCPPELIARGLRDAGHRVIVVGHTHYRTDILPSGHSRQTLIEEKFDCNEDGIVNLVGLCNPRVVVDLAFKAKAYLGSHSAYIMAAWHAGVPSLCLAPDSMKSHFERHDSSCWGFEKNKPWNALTYFSNAQEYGPDRLVAEWANDPVNYHHDRSFRP